MARNLRSAFSLFELLVIIAILLILLGLLLPAAQKARAAAARLESANNMKQIALACLNFESEHRHFPPGVDTKHFSAAARVLPYITGVGIDKLVSSIDFSKPIEDKVNADARKTVVQVFLSPLDTIQSVRDDCGATNYLYCAGSKPALADNDGIFFAGPGVKIPEIIDGTSNTLMIVETLKGSPRESGNAVDVNRQHVRFKSAALKGITEDIGLKDFADGKNLAADRGASWMDGRFLQGTFTATRKINDQRPDVDCGGIGGLSGPRGRMGGINAGFCDGHVMFMNEKESFDVLKAISTRNGGEKVDLP